MEFSWISSTSEEHARTAAELWVESAMMTRVRHSRSTPMGLIVLDLDKERLSNSLEVMGYRWASMTSEVITSVKTVAVEAETNRALSNCLTKKKKNEGKMKLWLHLDFKKINFIL